MAKAYVPFRNSRGRGGGAGRDIVANSAGPFSFIPELRSGLQNFAVYDNGGTRYEGAGTFTETKTNSGTIGMVAGGLQLVSGATSGNNTTMQLLRSITMAANKRTAFACRLQLTNIALGTAFFGLWNTQADPIGTAPTDGAYFKKATAGTGAIKAYTATGSSATDAGTIATLVNTTDVEFGILVSPSSTTAGIVQFYTRVSGGTWGAATYTASLTFPTGVLRAGFNINASSSAALTMTVPWWATAVEL